MTTIRERYEEAHRQMTWINSGEVEKEENFYILTCTVCNIQLGEII